MVEDFLRAKHDGPEAMKVWHNTALGLSWEERGELDMDELLMRRRQMYNCFIPEQVLVLTAAVDVQANRLEYEIVGWGAEKKSWGIQYGVIMGDPGQMETWTALDDVLFDIYTRADGQQLQIMTTCVDSGFNSSEVYAYCRARETRRVWAIKGRGGSGEAFIQRPKSRHASGCWLLPLARMWEKTRCFPVSRCSFQMLPDTAHFLWSPGEDMTKPILKSLHPSTE